MGEEGEKEIGKFHNSYNLNIRENLYSKKIFFKVAYYT